MYLDIGQECDADALTQGGFTHGFVCSFENKKDRDYYLHEDPAHLAFVKSLDGLVADVRVVDFEPGVY